jgi:hypothetical protein
MQQHIENSIGGSSQECDWAVFDHASWKDDGQLLPNPGKVRKLQTAWQHRFHLVFVSSSSAGVTACA